MIWEACFWCGSTLTTKSWHHAVLDRACCQACFSDPESNYRRTYGLEADVDDELAEVLRNRNR